MKSILIIDPDILLLYGLAKILRKEAVQVTTAPSVEIALDALSRNRYELCVLSLDFRNQSRLEDLAGKFVDMSGHMRIIALSAGEPEHNEQWQRIVAAAPVGACFSVAKPLDLFDFVYLVTNILANKDIAGLRRSSDSQAFRRRRRSLRRAYQQPVSYEIRAIISGASQRLAIAAQGIDISATGLGLKTPYPLQTGQVVSFGEVLENQTGVVVWSALIDDRWCRAGIRFGRPMPLFAT